MRDKKIFTIPLFLCAICLLLGVVSVKAEPITPWNEDSVNESVTILEKINKKDITNLTLDVGDPVDFDMALANGADYLRKMQADVTEDNAGNGNPDVPDDPDDGGWDWSTAAFTHSTAASPQNIYGATALGLYYSYLESPNAGNFTAMKDAADFIVAAVPPNPPRSGGDMKFLLLFNDLYSSVVGPTTVYADAAKAKYDDRITVYGSATLFAEYIRDARGVSQGYANGIIAWDIGIFAVIAQMLYDTYGGTYDVDADDIAEVLWQDSYNSNPGLFDVIGDQGFDPTWTDKNFWWYTLGITGLIDAFSASGNHASEIPDLVNILLESQYSSGGISGSYGANTDDEDWQSTAYAMMTLGVLDQASYQDDLNRMGYWLGATQDVSGGWVYSSGTHYPEIGGECTAGLYFTSNDITDVAVDASFTSQTDVDVYNAANGTNYIWGYTAFATIQEGIDAVTGSTVNIAPGTYFETLNITLDNLTLLGADRATVIIDPTGLATNNAGIYVNADNVTLESLTLRSTVTNSLPRYGIKFGIVDGCTLEDVTVKDVYRSGVDVLGASNLTILNVAVMDNGGHGLSLVDCNGIAVTDITLSGNGWQNVSVATWGRYSPLGTSGIVFNGTNTFGDLFQLEMGDYNNPGVPPAGDAVITYSTDILDGADVTVQASDFSYALHGEQDDSPDQTRIWFFSTLVNAAIIPGLGGGGHWTGSDMYIESLTDGTQLYITPGCSIQSATDAADPGDFINIDPGTYVGQVHITTDDLTYVGSGVDVTYVQSPATLIEFFVTSPNDNYPVVFVEGASNVSISDLTVDGNEAGNANYRFVGMAYWNSGGSVTDAKIINIIDSPFSGSQHGVGFYSGNDIAGTYSLVMTDVLVEVFQKSAVVLNGDGLTLDVDNVTTIGAGPTSVTAQNGIQVGSNVAGTLDNCTISGIAYTGATWTATGFLNYGNIVATGFNINNCQTSVYWTNGTGTFDGGAITNPHGDGFYAYNATTAKSSDPKVLPQPIDVTLDNSKASMNVLLSNTTITGVGTADSWGVGAFSTSVDPVDLTITGCTIENWDAGIFAYDYGSPVNCSVINGNLIANNLIGIATSASTNISMTVYNNSFNNAVNAEDNTAGGSWDDGVSVGNCWIDFSSNPGYPTQYNIAGTAGAFDNYPNVDCGVNISPDNILYHCDGSFTFDVSIGDGLSDLEAGSYTFEYPAELVFVSAASFDANITIFTNLTDNATGNDILVVDLLVGTGSQDGPADLFSIEMSGSTSYCLAENISMTASEMYNSDNLLIDCPLPSPTTIIADCDDPVFTLNGPATGDFYNTAPALDIQATDNCDIDAVYYQIDGCEELGWIAIAGTGYSGNSWNDVAWTVPGFAGMSEEEHCVRFKVIDDNGLGNSDSCSYFWCFTKDVTDPTAPVGFVAEPGHNKVKLNWDTNPDVVGYRIQRIAWNDYPLYVTPPAYPTDENDGTNVFDGPGNSNIDTYLLDNSSRDIYYYAVFAYDAAGNFSTGSNARSTSYWLGDIADEFTAFGNYDGYVRTGDLYQLGITYWYDTGDPQFESEADWGPTVGGNPKGIPVPDGSIDILDLAIFAINYDAVDPISKIVPIFADQTVNGPLSINLWQDESLSDNTYHLSLNNSSGEAKVLHIAMRCSQNNILTAHNMEIESEIAGYPVFAKIRQQNDIVEFDFALIGRGVGINGSGDIATLTFSTTDGSNPEVTLLEAQVFDTENKEVKVELINSAKPSSGLPNTFELSQNYPNPFNPTTTISYQVPHAEHVTISIYNITGQKVKTLVDNQHDAGIYSIVIDAADNGSTLSSGVYFYKMTAGNISISRKMVLLK